MTLRLNRLDAGSAIAAERGLPTMQFQLQWQTAMENIEVGVNGLAQAIDDITAAQTAADGATSDAAAAQGTANGAQSDATQALADAAAAQSDADAANAAIAALPVFASGSYMPTLTNGANVASSSGGVFKYIRLGSIVTVSGPVSVTATTLGLSTVLGISLPVASNFAASTDASGNAASGGGQQSGLVEADTANDRAQLRFISIGTSGLGMTVTFMYEII